MAKIPENPKDPNFSSEHLNNIQKDAFAEKLELLMNLRIENGIANTNSSSFETGLIKGFD